METKSRNIFDIHTELDRIAEAFDQLEELGTEEEVKAAVWNYFGDLTHERDDKLDRYAAFLTIKENRAKVLKEEAARLTAMAKVEENAAKGAKRMLHDFFVFKGIEKMETKFRKFWIQKNGGKIPVTLDPSVDPATLPKCYQVVTITADTEAIRTDLLAGIAVNGAELGEVGSHVRMK